YLFFSSPLIIYFLFLSFFLSNAPATTEIYTLSLHDALPISDAFAGNRAKRSVVAGWCLGGVVPYSPDSTSPLAEVARVALCGSRSEEHTSELQSRENLVCRLLLEKKKKK